VLRLNIEGFRNAVDLALRERMDDVNIGLQVHRLDLLSVIPPRQVAAAFEEVIEAEQDRSRSVSAARAYAARVLNEAHGDGSRIASESRAARQRLVSEAGADIEYFTAVREAYGDHPSLIAPTLWQDRIRRILRGVDGLYVVHENADGQQELRLMVGPRGEGGTTP